MNEVLINQISSEYSSINVNESQEQTESQTIDRLSIKSQVI